MATLYLAEFSTIEQCSNGGVMIATLPPLAEQVVPITAVSTQSLEFGPATRYIRVEVDAVCSIAGGRDPEATLTSMRLCTNDKEYFGVNPQDKIAVIANV